MAYSNPNLLPVDLSTFENNVNGWSATGSNCTTAVGTQRLSGSYGLKVTFTTAGFASAWTSTRTPVTAGSTYVCRIPVGTATAQAGLAVTAIVEWHTAATGGTKVSESSSPATTVNANAGFYGSSAPVVSGVAPAGATHATVKLAIGGSPTAGGHVLVDEVYLGLAKVLPGNLLSYAVQSVESDASGYQATGATLARSSVVLSTDTGYYALSATSTAAGSVDVRTSAYTPVTAGTEYVCYGLVNSASAAVGATYELRWYNGSGTLLSTSSFPGTLAQNVTTRAAMVGKAPAGATQCKLAFVFQATASGQTFYVDEVSLTLAPNVAGNLLTYDEYSTEAGLTPWTVTNGTYSRAFFTSSISDGYYALKVVPSGPDLVSMTLDRLVPVEAGKTYQAETLVYRHNPGAESIVLSARSRLDWYDASGAILQADNPDQFYTAYSAVEYAAMRVAETRLAPDGAAFARIGLEIDPSLSLADFYDVDCVVLKEATPLYTLGANDALGMVALTVNYSAAPTATSVTIKRMDQDGSAVPVRGYGQEYDRAPYSTSPVVLEDYEAPLGTRIWYSVEWFDSSGTLAARLFTQTITSPVLPDGDYVWFKSPGLPALNVTVMMETAIKWERAARKTSLAIVGRKNPVDITDVRLGRTGTLSVLIWDEPSHVLFDQLLDPGLPVLIQAMPGYGLPGNLYLSVGDVSSESVVGVANDEGWRWTLAVNSVDRPEGGLQGSAAGTWQDVLGDYGTWSAVDASFPSWTEVLTYKSS
jgi:hypothetical protein